MKVSTNEKRQGTRAHRCGDCTKHHSNTKNAQHTKKEERKRRGRHNIASEQETEKRTQRIERKHTYHIQGRENKGASSPGVTASKREIARPLTTATAEAKQRSGK